MLNAEQKRKLPTIDPATQQRLNQSINDVAKAFERMTEAIADAALALHVLSLQLEIAEFKARRDTDQAQTAPGAPS